MVLLAIDPITSFLTGVNSEELLGDVEAALDHIIALQEELIGDKGDDTE